MIRGIVGVCIGLVAAVVVIGALEAAGHAVYPPPPGIDLHDPEALKTIIDQLPRGAIVMVLVAWGLGSLVGGFTAAAVAGRARVVCGLIVGAVLMTFAAITMVMIPHPVWFMNLSVAVILPPAGLGALAAKWLLDRGRPQGPRPSDMREKNMAC